MNMLPIICCFVHYRRWYHTCLYHPVEPATEPRKSCTCRKSCNRYPNFFFKMLLIMWSLYCVFPGGHGVLGALGTPSIMACLSLEHAWGKLKVSCHSFWKCIIALHWNEAPWWEVLVCTILSCSCNAMQGWAMVGSLCVLNSQVWCNAMMSYCGKFFVCSTLSCAQQFLTRIFYVWKIAVTPQTKRGALRAQWHFCHHQCCTSHYTHGIWILQPWICSWSLLWRGKQVYSTQLLQQTYTAKLFQCFAWQVLFSGQFVQYPVMQTLAERKRYFCLCNRV